MVVLNGNTLQYKTNMIEQRSLEWKRQRLGMITASEFYNLMKNHKEEISMTDEEIENYKLEHPKARNIPTTKKVEAPFSDATFTYLDRKIMERYIPQNGADEEYLWLHDVPNKAMMYGTDNESSARRCYAERMGYEVIEVEFIPLDGYEKFCGVSSDGIVRGAKGGVELKCPYNIEHHVENLLMQNGNDLLDLRPEYYWQVRLNMFAWDTEWWDFVSFCPFVAPSKQLKVLRIYRDNGIDNEIKKRLDLAVSYIKKRMNQIKNTPTIII